MRVVATTIDALAFQHSEEALAGRIVGTAANFRKVSQTFDERTNEHVIMIEYRVRRGGDDVVTKNHKQKRISKLKLLSRLAAQARAQGR